MLVRKIKKIHCTNYFTLLFSHNLVEQLQYLCVAVLYRVLNRLKIHQIGIRIQYLWVVGLYRVQSRLKIHQIGIQIQYLCVGSKIDSKFTKLRFTESLHSTLHLIALNAMTLATTQSVDSIDNRDNTVYIYAHIHVERKRERAHFVFWT